MIWLLALFALFLLSSPADAAIAERAGTKANCHNGLATQVICSTAGNVTSGDLVCARVITNVEVATVTETALGISLQAVGNDLTGVNRHKHACGRAPSTGTATFQVDTTNSTPIAVEVIAFSGTFTAGNVLDVDGGTSINTTTVNLSAPITTATASTVVLGSVVQADDPAATVAPANGETESTELTNWDTSGMCGQWEYRVEVTAGAKTVQWTASGVNGYRMYVSSWKETAAVSRGYGIIGAGTGPVID